MRYPLDPPFMVLATQNPVEYEGTYPLPEAQLDRFLFKVVVPYPSETAEVEIVRRYHQGFDAHHLESSGLQAVIKPLTCWRCTPRSRPSRSRRASWPTSRRLPVRPGAAPT